MTDLEKAARMALEALKFYELAGLSTFKTLDAITALRQALSNSVEQPAQQEPKKFDPNESFAREEAAQARVREFMRNH